METRSNGYIFICGESSCENDAVPSTKSILLSSLASNWAVRTHYEPNGIDPRNDRATLFRNIASSYVFLFIFSEETTMNAFYLNQLGVAFGRGVSIIGIREPSYIMPNPLPEHYYSTEVIDLTGARTANDGRNRPNDFRNRPNSRGKSILANVLIECFRNAVVYTADFHKSCLERLFRKVTDSYVKSEKERCFLSSVNLNDCSRTTVKDREVIRQKVWACVGCMTKCPKCGTPFKTTRKTSMLRKTNSVDNLFKKDPSRPTARPQTDAPQLMITKSVLQPVVLQPSFSKTVFQAGTRRPATSVIRQSFSARVGSLETRIERNRACDSRPTSSKSCNAIPGSSSRLQVSPKLGEIKDIEPVRDAVTEVNHNTKENSQTFVRRKTSTTGFITNKRGALLRKMSSLPCIPTTYLVTDPASEEPAFVKYPPVQGNISDDDTTDIPEFTDDEDKEVIHISRRPSQAISTCSTNIE